MRSRSTVLALALLAAVTASPQTHAQGAARRLEEIAPDNVFAFAQFAGLGEAGKAARTSEVFKLLQEPEVRHFVRHMMAGLDRTQKDGGFMDGLGEIKLARWFLEKRISVAVGGMTLAWDRDEPMPLPGVVVAFDMAGEHDEFLGRASAVIDQIPVRSRESVEYRGHTMTVLTPPDDVDVRVFLAPVGDLYLVGFNEFLVKKCVDGAHGAKNTLDKSDAFRRSRKRAPTKPLLEAFLNTRAIADRIGGTLPDEWGAAVEKLGLADVNGIYFASGLEGGVGHDVMFIDAPAPRRGLLALESKHGVENSLGRIPSSALYAAAWRWRPGDLWDTVMTVMSETLPNRARQEMQRELARAEQELGMSLRKDLIGLLGEEVILYADAPHDQFLPSFVLSVEVTDTNRAQSVVRGLLDRAGAPVRTVTWKGKELHVIRSPDDEVPVSPTICFHNGRMLVSPTVAGIREALAHGETDGPGLAGSDTFSAAMTRFGFSATGATSVEYLDGPRVVGWLARVAEHLLPGAPMDSGVPLDLAEMPSAETFVKHTYPYLAVSHCQKDGIHVRAVGSGTADLLGLMALGAGDREMTKMPFVLGWLALAPQGMESAPGSNPFGAAEPRAVPGRIVVRPERAPTSRPTSRPTRENAASAPPAVSEATPEPITPERIVNPLKPGDPREAELTQQLADLSDSIADDRRNADLYLERALVYGQLRKYDEAIADYHRMRALGQKTNLVAYNLACMYSLQGKKDEAIAWLDNALENGFNSVKHLQTDSDLDNIRKDRRFQDLLNRKKK